MTRTTITSTQANRCTLTYEDDMGRTVERDFSAPQDGGYVREHHDSGNTTQPCERLSKFGATLIWHPSSRTPTLADLIRRERKAALAAERRRWARR